MAAVSTEETPAIIEVAINGITSPEIKPQRAADPEAIAADALACFDGGAAIIHTHNHDISLTGADAAGPYIEAMAPVLAARPDALWYPTLTSGDHQAKYAHMGMIAAELPLRMVAVDPGSTNIGGAGPDGLPVGGTYKNDYAEIRASFDLCRDNGWAPAMAIYEPGFLQCVLTYHRVGQLPAGSMAKLYFGAEWGLSAGTKGVTFGLHPHQARPAGLSRHAGGHGIPWSASVWAATSWPPRSPALPWSSAATFMSASRSSTTPTAPPPTKNSSLKQSPFAMKSAAPSPPAHRPPTCWTCPRRRCSPWCRGPRFLSG